MTTDQADHVDVLVIFGATGDLAKVDTFPALVALVKRGALDVPVIGVADSGWNLDQFRDYATASMKAHNIDPGSPAAVQLPPAPVPGIVSGWVVRDVYRGAAILQGRMGGMIEVGPGDILPGVGRIEAIRRQDGRWVVMTTKGMIVSMR